MKILLIAPEFPDTFWSFKHALKFVGKRAALPPLGLLTVAAMLPDEWEKRLVDLNTGRLKRADLDWADCAFVTGMAVQRESARTAIARCAEAGLTVVAGGPLFTSEHADFPEVDHFVLNEAEHTLPRFLRDFADGRARRIYEEDGFPEIAETPVPLWGLADLKRYASMSLQYSRGCPFDCEFCNVTSLFGHRPRIKRVAQVIAELDALQAAGWRDSVFFVDDNFIGNKRRLKEELLPALIAWQREHRGVSFYTEVSINIADDDELMSMMVDAGFDTVFIGIETPDDSSLNECGKVQNRNRDLVADVHRIHRAGLQVQGGFIVGFDSDTPSIFQRQIDFIQNSGIVTAMVGMLQAIPGTKLFKRMEAEGRLSGQTSGDNIDGTTNFVPKMDLPVLRDGYAALMKKLYTPRNFYQRVRTFLREYRAPTVKVPLRFMQVRAFLRSLLLLGVVGRERFQYWKLMVWTLLRRPNLLPLAVTLAIYGHHFRKVAKLHVG